MVHGDERMKPTNFLTLVGILDDGGLFSGLEAIVQTCCRAPPSLPAVANFGARAWPAYLEAVYSSSYFFTVDELIAICRMHGVSVAVCREVRGQLFFVGGCFDGDGPVACVKISANGTRRVRSHFERLLPRSDGAGAGDGDRFQGRGPGTAGSSTASVKAAGEGAPVGATPQPIPPPPLPHPETRRSRSSRRRPAAVAGDILSDGVDAAVIGSAGGGGDAAAGLQASVGRKCDDESSPGMPAAAPSPEPRGSAQETGEEWSGQDLCHVVCRAGFEKRFEFQKWLDVAESLSEGCIRARPTLCRDDVDVSSGARSPGVACAFRGCTWQCAEGNASAEQVRRAVEHPWDAALRGHVEEAHGQAMQAVVQAVYPGGRMDGERSWGLYCEAIACRERKLFPAVGLTVDRRCMDYTLQVYNDECVRSLICFACARICLDTGSFWSDIGYVSGEWLFGLPAKALKHNFSMELFQQRYCQSGTPLAPLGPGMRRPDFGEWTLEIDPEVFEHAMTGQLGKDGRGRGVLDLKETLLICCPEDHECARGCPSRTRGR